MVMEKHTLKKNHVDKLFLVLTSSFLAPEECQEVNKGRIKNKGASTVKEGGSLMSYC